MSEKIILPALTLWSPWGTFIVEGFKEAETRSWKPSDRFFNQSGRFWLAVHQGKGTSREVKELCEAFGPVGNCLGFCGYSSLDETPKGCILGFARVCQPIRTEKYFAGSEEASREYGTPEYVQRELGDFRPGRWAWPIDSVIRLSDPVPCSGGRNLWKWEVPSEIVADVREGTRRQQVRENES